MTSADTGRAGDAFAGPDWQPSPDERGRIRVRRRRRRHKWRRRVLIGSAAFVFGLLAAAAWLLYDGLKARADLRVVQVDVAKLKSEITAGDLTAARVTAQSLRSHADSAHRHSTSPVWRLAQHLPVIGGNLEDAGQLVSVVDSVADDVVPPLVDAVGALDPQRLRRADGSIDLATIQRTAPSLARVSATLRTAITRVAHVPDSGWAGVDNARRQLALQLPHLASTVRAASLAAHVLPPLLGVDGPRNYLVSFENEAEMRGVGGLPGALAVLHVDHGRMGFSRFESDTYLGDATAPGLDFGAAFRGIYGTGKYAPTAYYGNSDLSPHYPYAARIWMGMWRQKTGQTLNGAFAIDPTALSYLLAVSGPVTLPDATVVDANNVVALTQATVYAKFDSQVQRKKYLLEIAEAISHKLLSPQVNLTELIKAAGRAANESRLLFWTSDPKIENSLTQFPMAGVEPETKAPYFRLTLWNSTASKLDYYISATVDWTRTGCGPKRHVTATVRLTNSAPPHLPSYVLGATADPSFHIPPGDEYLGILAHGTHGANLVSMTVDGKRADYSLFHERGHPVWSDGKFIAPGKTVVIVYRIVEPAGTGAPVVPAQPMVHPMSVTVHDTVCR